MNQNIHPFIMIYPTSLSSIQLYIQLYHHLEGCLSGPHGGAAQHVRLNHHPRLYVDDDSDHVYHNDDDHNDDVDMMAVNIDSGEDSSDGVADDSR